MHFSCIFYHFKDSFGFGIGFQGRGCLQAKRRCSQGLDAAKAVRLWCRGERTDLPNLMEVGLDSDFAGVSGL